jgi:hypothetical protein
LYEECAHFYENVYLDAIVGLVSDGDPHLKGYLLREDFKEVLIDLFAILKGPSRLG